VDQWGNWLTTGSEKSRDTYMKHFWTSTSALVQGSRAVAALAGLGYLFDRFGYTPPRHLIPFCFYAGFVSIFGYPLGTDIGAPWLAAHMVVPLAVPAAVGLAAMVRWGAEAIETDDAYQLGSASIVLLLLSVLVAQSAVGQVYTSTTQESNPMVQYAQPDAELKDELRKMDRLAAANEGSTDVVVYYGEQGTQWDKYNAYVGPDRNEWDQSYWNNRPTCMMWFNSLPLPWYFAAGEMDVQCENSDRNLASLTTQNPPPVIITQQFDPTVPRAQLNASGYESETHRMRTTGDRNLFTVWTNEAAVGNGTAQ